jgi:hypothetical protein
MSHYLKSVWAMLSPFKEEGVPLLAHPFHDLEACAHAPPLDSDSVVLVCETPLELPVYSHSHPNQHVRVSPFSEYHFPLRPFGSHAQHTASTHA